MPQEAPINIHVMHRSRSKGDTYTSEVLLLPLGHNLLQQWQLRSWPQLGSGGRKVGRQVSMLMWMSCINALECRLHPCKHQQKHEHEHEHEHDSSSLNYLKLHSSYLPPLFQSFPAMATEELVPFGRFPAAEDKQRRNAARRLASILERAFLGPPGASGPSQA